MSETIPKSGGERICHQRAQLAWSGKEKLHCSFACFSSKSQPRVLHVTSVPSRKLPGYPIVWLISCQALTQELDQKSHQGSCQGACLTPSCLLELLTTQERKSSFFCPGLWLSHILWVPSKDPDTLPLMLECSFPQIYISQCLGISNFSSMFIIQTLSITIIFSISVSFSCIVLATSLGTINDLGACWISPLLRHCCPS